MTRTARQPDSVRLTSLVISAISCLYSFGGTKSTVYGLGYLVANHLACLLHVLVEHVVEVHSASNSVVWYSGAHNIALPANISVCHNITASVELYAVQHAAFLHSAVHRSGVQNVAQVYSIPPPAQATSSPSFAPNSPNAKSTVQLKKPWWRQQQTKWAWTLRRSSVYCPNPWTWGCMI